MIKAIRTEWSGLRQQVGEWVQAGGSWASRGWPLGGVRESKLGESSAAQGFASVESGLHNDSVVGMSKSDESAMLDQMRVGVGVTVWDAVDILWETGGLLVLAGEARSRRAGFNKASQYLEENAARWRDIASQEMEQQDWPEEVCEAVVSLQRDEIPSLYRELRTSQGEHATDLLRVRGIGPDKATSIHEELKIWTLREVKEAAKSGVLLQVKGIGPKSIQRLEGNIDVALEEQRVRNERKLEARKALRREKEAALGPRDVLEVLRCPATHQSDFAWSDAAAVVQPTGRHYPVVHDVIDMVGEGHEAPSLTQSVMESRLYAQFYEAVFRPGLTRFVTRRSIVRDIALSLELLRLEPEWSVLDVACGPGNYTRAIAQALDPVRGLAVGTDISWSMLRKAAERSEHKHLANLHFVRGSALHLPFQDDSFHAVHCTAALHLFSEPGRALQEFHRVTRPEGRLVVGTFLKSRFLPLRLAQRLGSPFTGFHWFSLEELEELIVSTGYTIERTEIDGLAISVAARRRE